MDFYSEYNRIRRNLMRQAKYHNISLTKIPTAKQLLKSTGKNKITSAQVKTIKVQQKSLQTIIKSKIPKIKSIPTPKSKTEPKQRKSRAKATPQKRGRKPDYGKYYSKYATSYIQTTSEGKIIDRFTGDELGSTLWSTDEEIGKYIYEKYRDEKTRRMKQPENFNINKAVRELEQFEYYIESRILTAMEDYNSEGNKHGASKLGADVADKLLRKLKQSDWEDAYNRYKEQEDMIKMYLDQALYYTSQVSDHARAIVVIANLLDLDVADFDIDEAENTYYDLDEVYAKYAPEE